jgi:hypothetical protein
VIFLFFASFNLFAQRQEFGRLTWEFRDYERKWRFEIPEQHQKYHWMEKDETGAAYYGFNATYIIYREPR